MNAPPEHALVSAEDVPPPAAAAVTAIEEAPPASVASETPTATALGLLRDWQTPPPAVATAETAPPATTAATPEATATPAFSPPLAPSVLLGERVSSRSYPVARSIVTLVRGAVDAVADHIHDHMHITNSTPTTTEHGTTTTTTTSAAAAASVAAAPIECLSIRSEGGLPTTTTSTSHLDNLPHIAADSVRSVPAQTMDRGDDFMAMEDQFVLIDGDLVALPPPPNQQEREGLEEYQRDELADMRKSCQPKPMRRGVRGVKKWIKRKLVSKKNKDKKQQQQREQEDSILSTEHSPNVSQCEVSQCETTNTATTTAVQQEVGDGLAPPSACAAAAVNASTSSTSTSSSKRSPRKKSPMRGWRNMKRDKKEKDALKNQHKKKRASWRNMNSKKGSMLESEPYIIPEEEEEEKFVNETHQSTRSRTAAAAASPPAAAGAAEAAAMPQLQQQHDPNPLHPHLSLMHQQQLQQQQQQQLQQDQQQLQQTSLQDPSTAAAATQPTTYNHHHHQDQAAAAAYAHHEDVLDPLAPPAAAYAYHDPLLAPVAPAAAYSYESLPPANSMQSTSMAMPPMSGPPTQQDSVHASFVGNVDEVAGVLEAATCAEAYIESAAYWPDEKKDEGCFSVLPPDADYKVDKADAPDVEYMLRRAEADDVLERESDEDGSYGAMGMGMPPPPQRLVNNKTTGMSCPLSTAKVTDEVVHNDVLKVVMVGAPGCDKSALARAIRQSNKKPKRRTTLGVDVHSWTPEMDGEPVKFTIWDVQGASQQHSDANFGANPGIQSLFFSSNALYLLVWDLAADNMKTYGRDFLLDQLEREEEEDDDEDDDEEEDNQFVFEEARRQADLVLQADIEKRVLTWIECIAKRGPGSSILPVAVIPEHMSTEEAKRRCDLMQNLLEHHIRRYENDPSTPKLLIGMDNIMCVSLDKGSGIHELQETLIAIAADGSVFDHVGSTVSNATVKVLDTVRRLKQDHKLVRVDHLMAELGKHILSYDEITDALHFLSSIGELLYFGNEHDELLSRYIILSRKWFVSALSCILRNDLKRELSETRRFMNMQCIYSNHQFPECPVIQSLTGGSASTCPLLSSTDTNMLWLSMQFMREAADRSSQLSESSTTSSTMFGFLERLLVQSGVFLPLNVSQSMDDAEVYFVPSLMATATDNNDVWTFKSSEGWMTTLCHSWLFRDGAPSDLMEHIIRDLVRDLYEFSRTFPSVDLSTPPHRSQSFPLVRSGASDFLRAHDSDAIGRIKIHQIMCWQSSFLVKIGCIFADPEGELKESFVEVFVTLVDQSSSHCVASDAMRATMQRLVVSGKGQAGSHGAKLWKGGFEVVLKSIQTTLGDFSNIDRQVVCPECLSHSQPRFASTWSWDSVKAAAESGSSIVRCIRGHRVDSNLICGTAKRQEMSVVHEQPLRSVKAVSELLHSVVLVGLWDADSKEIRNVGSGFIADKRLGLIVTAGHVLFNMEEGTSFGTPYFGYKNAKVVIGVIPDGGHNAVYRYFAEIIADDISGVDACVVRLTSKITTDVDGDLNQKPDDALESSQLNLEAIHQESLRSLKLTTRFELEESVRILGFNQGGEGLLEKGKHVNRSADFAKGYICKKFVAPPMSEDDSSHSSEMSCKSMCFVPREEVVVICPTIAGHSGGPCVNNDGKVVGILSRADPGERQRCYLVPSSELKDLIKKAKKHFTRPSVGMTL